MAISQTGVAYPKWAEQQRSLGNPSSYQDWKTSERTLPVSAYKPPVVPTQAYSPTELQAEAPAGTNTAIPATSSMSQLAMLSSPNALLSEVKKRLMATKATTVDPLEQRSADIRAQLMTTGDRTLERLGSENLERYRVSRDMETNLLRSQLQDVEARIENRQRSINDMAQNLSAGTSELFQSLIAQQQQDVENKMKLRQLEMDEEQQKMNKWATIAELQLKTPMGKKLKDLGFTGAEGEREGLATGEGYEYQAVPFTDEFGNISNRIFNKTLGQWADELPSGGATTGGGAGGNVAFTPGEGWRTDRNNNPIAAAVKAGGTNEFTKALENAGIRWSYGDPFPNNPSMVTIKIDGDPVEGARAILSDSNSIQNWYVNHTGKDILSKYGVKNNQEFATLPVEDQNQIIAGIYSAEVGNGSLMAGVTTVNPKYTASTTPAVPNPMLVEITQKYSPEQLAVMDTIKLDKEGGLSSTAISTLNKSKIRVSDYYAYQGAKQPEPTQAQITAADAIRAKHSAALDNINTILDNKLYNWAGPKSATKDIPILGSMMAGRLEGLIQTIKSNVGLSEMAALKAASSTGATGLGTMSDAEMLVLTSSMGSLDITKQMPEDIKKTLERIKASFERADSYLNGATGYSPSSIDASDEEDFNNAIQSSQPATSQRSLPYIGGVNIRA